MEPCDILPITPVCVASDAASDLAGNAAGTVFDGIAGGFANAASSVLDAVFEAISTSTTVDLGASYVSSNASALAAVALVLVMGLFVIQVATAAIRQEPGGLLRAITGAGVGILGAAAAATVTQALLVAVDGISDGIAGLAGTSIEAAARTLLDVSILTGMAQVPGGGAALMILFGLLFIIGAALILGTLLVREALIVVAVIVAPLAFAGSTARITSGWVRRWIQVTLALILSKLAIVIVFVVAVGMVGDRDGIGGLLSGLILLLLACLAPWACFKILDFAGTAVASEWHRATNGSTLAAVNQGRASAQSLMRMVAPVVGGGAGGAIGAGGAGGGARRASGGQAPGLPTSGRGAAESFFSSARSGAGAGAGSSSGASSSPSPGQRATGWVPNPVAPTSSRASGAGPSKERS